MTHSLRLAMACACAMTIVPGLAGAQHEARRPASAPASGLDATQCLRVQPVIENIITAALDRAEAARLSNSPAEMRAAVESLAAALRDIRAQSAPCSTAASSTESHAGHPAAPSGEKQRTPR